MDIFNEPKTKVFDIECDEITDEILDSVVENCISTYNSAIEMGDETTVESEMGNFWDDYEKLHHMLYISGEVKRSQSINTIFGKTCEKNEIKNLSTSFDTLSTLNTQRLSESFLGQNQDEYLDKFYQKIEPEIFSLVGDISNQKHVEVHDQELRAYFIDVTNVPTRFVNVFKLYEQNLLGNWSVPEMMDLIKNRDMVNFPKLHPVVQYRIRHAVMWLVVGDGLVARDVLVDTTSKFVDGYRSILFGFVKYLEGSVHQVFYTFDFDVVTQGTRQEKQKFIKELESTSFIKGKIQWCNKYKNKFVPRVLWFLSTAILEGIGFLQNFNPILAIQDLKNGLPGLVMGTKLVLRDENRHVLNWINEFVTMRIRPPQKVVRKMVMELIEIEFAYLDYQEDKMKKDGIYNLKVESGHYEIPRDLDALTTEKQKKSLMFQANYCLGLCGYNFIFDVVEQPIEFLENRGDKVMAKSNLFFEERNALYYNINQKAFFDFIWQRRIKFCETEEEFKHELARNLNN